VNPKVPNDVLEILISTKEACFLDPFSKQLMVLILSIADKGMVVPV
jgi:hypothetical protein